MYYISVALILTELFHLEYLNLRLIISWFSDWISINRPPFDSSYREESNDMYYISIVLILIELFRFEFYNKNLTLFYLYFDPISTLFRPSGSRTWPFRSWGFNFGFMYNNNYRNTIPIGLVKHINNLDNNIRLYYSSSYIRWDFS